MDGWAWRTGDTEQKVREGRGREGLCRKGHRANLPEGPRRLSQKTCRIWGYGPEAVSGADFPGTGRLCR